MPNAFGNYSAEEFDAVERERARLEFELGERAAEVIALQESSSRLEAADRIGKMAREAVQRAETEGELQEIAEAELAVEIAEPVRREKIETIKENLVEAKREEVEAEVNDPKWVTATRDEYNEMYEADGTYRAIRKDVVDDAKAKIREQLLAKKKIAIEAELSDPEAEEKLRAEVEKDVETELDDYRKELIADQPKHLKAKAVELGKARIDAEVQADSVAKLEGEVKTWLKSDDATRYRQKAQEEARQGRLDTVQREGRVQIDGKLAKDQEIFDTYFRDFAGGGVDLSTIPAGVSVTVVLGSTQEVKNPEYSYNNTRVPEKILKLNDLSRVLKFLSRGEGRFLVQDDSLADSKNPYVEDDSVEGKVFTIGQKVEDKTKEHPVIESKISQGEILFFDDDATDPDELISGKLPVLDIVIGGVHADPKLKSISA